MLAFARISQIIHLDKRISREIFFSYFSTKTYVVGTHWNRLDKAIPMSTHNICFRGKIRKISVLFVRKSVLSGATSQIHSAAEVITIRRSIKDFFSMK